MGVVADGGRWTFGSILVVDGVGPNFQCYILLDEMQGSGKTDIGEEMNKEVFACIVPAFIKAGARCMTVPGSGVASVW